jgi:hypothetical protein
MGIPSVAFSKWGRVLRWLAARAGESPGGSGLSGRPVRIDELSLIQTLYHNNSDALDQFEIKLWGP